MGISPTRLPRLLGDLVLAFAAYEPHPLLGAVELLPVMAIRLAHRWVSGRLLATEDGRAVLLWSVAAFESRRRPRRQDVLGFVAAVAVGIVLALTSCTILLLPVAVVLIAVGVSTMTVLWVILSVVGLRLLLTGVRTFRSYQSERAFGALVPPASDVRWRIDYLAAVPPRQGNGGDLVDRFVARADERGAEVILHCDDRNVSFYRHHGFRVVSVESPGSQRLMVHRVRSPQPRTRADVGRGHRQARHV